MTALDKVYALLHALGEDVQPRITIAIGGSPDLIHVSLFDHTAATARLIAGRLGLDPEKSETRSKPAAWGDFGEPIDGRRYWRTWGDPLSGVAVTHHWCQTDDGGAS